MVRTHNDSVLVCPSPIFLIPDMATPEALIQTHLAAYRRFDWRRYS